LRVGTGSEGSENPQRCSDEKEHESGFVERRFDEHR
jgi:hypothetical protein